MIGIVNGIARGIRTAPFGIMQFQVGFCRRLNQLSGIDNIFGNRQRIRIKLNSCFSRFVKCTFDNGIGMCCNKINRNILLVAIVDNFGDPFVASTSRTTHFVIGVDSLNGFGGVSIHFKIVLLCTL